CISFGYDMPGYYGNRGHRKHHNNRSCDGDSEDSDSTSRAIINFATFDSSALLTRVDQEVEPFPLLDLPDEIIEHIFSFLPMRHRVKMRLSQRLERIYLGGKFRDHGFVIEQCLSGTFVLLRRLRRDGFEAMMFRLGEQGHSVPRIEQVHCMLSRTSYGEVRVELPQSYPVHALIYDAIRDVCRTDSLSITAQEIRCSTDEDANLLRLVREKREVTLRSEGSPRLITLASLTMVHQALLHESMPLKTLKTSVDSYVIADYLVQLITAQLERSRETATRIALMMEAAFSGPAPPRNAKSAKVVMIFERHLKISIASRAVSFTVFDDDAALAEEKERYKGAIIIN
ncbi:hypothetical protein PFISCL1PPCAC_22773, partial [Pristionchus fissidentatus]